MQQTLLDKGKHLSTGAIAALHTRLMNPKTTIYLKKPRQLGEAGNQGQCVARVRTTHLFCGSAVKVWRGDVLSRNAL